MIQNPELVEAFERRLIASEPPNYLRSLALFEAMWREAVALGVLPSKDPLEGIEVDIALAKALHVRPTPGADL
jgi:hypothetical protein